MIHQFAARLRERLKAEYDRQADALASGGISTFDEYRHMTGVIHGLVVAEREMEELLKQYTED